MEKTQLFQIMDQFFQTLSRSESVGALRHIVTTLHNTIEAPEAVPEQVVKPVRTKKTVVSKSPTVVSKSPTVVSKAPTVEEKTHKRKRSSGSSTTPPSERNRVQIPWAELTNKQITTYYLYTSTASAKKPLSQAFLFHKVGFLEIFSFPPLLIVSFFRKPVSKLWRILDGIRNTATPLAVV